MRNCKAYAQHSQTMEPIVSSQREVPLMALDADFVLSWERSQEQVKCLTCTKNLETIFGSRQTSRGDNGRFKSSTRAIP
jgi:hypothetical protein